MLNRSILGLSLCAAALLMGCAPEAPSPQQLHAYSLFASAGLTNTQIIDKYGPPHDVPISLINKHGQKIEYWTYSFPDSTKWDPTFRWHVALKLVDEVRTISGGQSWTARWSFPFYKNPHWPLDWDALRQRAYEDRVLGPNDSSFQAIIRSHLENPWDPRF